MNFKRLLTTPMGQIFLSIVMGLGLASLFRKVCTDKNCIVFQGPIIADFEANTYKQGDTCYQYSTTVEKCDSSKKIVDIRDPPAADEIKPPQPLTTSATSIFGGIFGNNYAPAPAPAVPVVVATKPPSAMMTKMASL